MPTQFSAGRLLAPLCLLFSLVVTGCGGGGSGGGGQPPQSGSGPETGQVTVAITDAEGDFTRYEVDVNSIELRTRAGDSVSVLPRATRIDFAELTEVTELLSIATVPRGDYVEAVLNLDFGAADVRVQDANGDDEQAELIDSAGMPVAELAVTLTLADQDVIRIRPGRPALFSLDFDLDASNSIDTSTSPATVTVEPFLIAMAELETDREHRMRGLLQDVDTGSDSIEIAVRPFRSRAGGFGELTIGSNADTAFEINGEGYSGSDGLTALAQLPTESPIVAALTVASDAHPTATTVLAGTSVPWSDADVLVGVVKARLPDALTVAGARVQLANGGRIDRGEVTVLVGPDTDVAAAGTDSAGAISAASVSVGQRVLVRGEFVDDVTLDATAGSIGLRRTSLVAQVVEPSPLVVDLVTLAGRRPGFYDFTGTGLTTELDSDPQAYEVEASSLPLTAVAGEYIRVSGRTGEFGVAPPDFIARSVVNPNVARLRASVALGWPEPSSQPFRAVSDDRLDVLLDDTRSALSVAGRSLGELTAPFALVATDNGNGAYAVRVRGSGSVTLYRQFSDFSAALVDALDSGQQLARLSASGRYDDGSGEMTAVRASALLVQPAP